MKYTIGLRCRECKREYSINPIHVCEFCLGPLGAIYDYGRIKERINFRKIVKRQIYGEGRNGSPCSNP